MNMSKRLQMCGKKLWPTSRRGGPCSSGPKLYWAVPPLKRPPKRAWRNMRRRSEGGPSRRNSGITPLAVACCQRMASWLATRRYAYSGTYPPGGEGGEALQEEAGRRGGDRRGWPAHRGRRRRGRGPAVRPEGPRRRRQRQRRRFGQRQRRRRRRHPGAPRRARAHQEGPS